MPLEQDEDVDVRLAAARALGHFRHPQAVAALGSTLDERDPALRNRGLLALRDAAEVDLGMDLAAWQDHVATVVASLEQDTSLASLPSTPGPAAESVIPAGATPPSYSAPAVPAGGYSPEAGSAWPVQPAAGERSIYGN